MMKIHYEAREIWTMFQLDKVSLRTNMRVIAENPEFGVMIYLTSDGEGSFERPLIQVYADDDLIYEETILSYADCARIVSEIYESYLEDDNIISYYFEQAQEEDKKEEQDRRESEIEEREEDLDNAVYEFLSIILDASPYELDQDVGGGFVDDCKEHFLEYIARKWDVQLYRPMILEDEDGEEFFEEYPYDAMIFDDEDNPIYQ